MKKIIIVLLLLVAGMVYGQPESIPPKTTTYTRTILDDPNALEARDTLELGTDDDPNFVSINLSGDHVNIATIKTPASASAAGTKGDIAWDTSYLYICTATNTWERVAIATWGATPENVIYAGEDVIYAGENVVYP